jgi:hypothetical protein
MYKQMRNTSVSEWREFIIERQFNGKYYLHYSVRNAEDADKSVMILKKEAIRLCELSKEEFLAEAYKIIQ